MGVAQAFSACLRAALVVVGELPELDLAPLLDLPIRRLPDGRLDGVPVATAAVVVDLRDVPLDAVVAWRRRSTLDVPLLLATPGALDESLALEARATDVLAIDEVRAPSLGRRLRMAVDLGRARLALSFADQALAESVNGIAIADASTQQAPLVAVSKVFERLTQYKREELLGKNCRLLQRRDRDQLGVEQLRTAVRNQSRTTALVRNYKKDGSLFWNEVTVFPILVNGVLTEWMAGVQHDVTRVVEAQAEIETLYRMLLEQRTFDNAILDGVEVGIITTNRAGGVTFANRSALRLLGTGNVVGEDVREVLGLPADPATLLGEEPRRLIAYAFLACGRHELELELLLSRADGAPDTRVGFFFIFRDVAVEKQRETERQKLERLAAMGTMVAGFAHEVRNPVAALRSIAEELAEEPDLADAARPHTTRILRILERIERLVRTSLQFGRPQAPKRSPCRPWTVCSVAISAVAPRTRAAGQELSVDVDPDLPDVFVDDGQLAQAIIILLENGLDAAGSPRGVRLRATRAPGAVRFEVIDDGPGIAEDDLSRIFDPFFTTKPSGTGLGLSIAQQLVSENGGRLEVESRSGGPTTFCVIAPTS